MECTHVDHVSQAKDWLHNFPDRLYVVTAVSNPARYAARYRLYRAFEKHVRDNGAILTTVEMAYGDRPFEVTSAGNPQHVQARGRHELWYKENLLNIGIARLPASAKYIAIVDADLIFTRPDWAQETLHQLQHHPVVQMFSQVSQLSPEDESLGNGPSFVEAWRRGKLLRTVRGQAQSQTIYRRPLPLGYPGAFSELGAPGGAWAFRREALDQLGGLIDYSLVGSADYFMAAGLFGLMDLVVHPNYHSAFTTKLFDWQARAERHVRRNVGVVPGLLLHRWHGKMSQRHYGTRWGILCKHNFNPHTDLKYDSQGLLQLEDDGTPRFIGLRDDLVSYFRARNEDSIEIDGAYEAAP